MSLVYITLKSQLIVENVLSSQLTLRVVLSCILTVEVVLRSLFAVVVVLSSRVKVEVVLRSLLRIEVVLRTLFKVEVVLSSNWTPALGPFSPWDRASQEEMFVHLVIFLYFFGSQDIFSSRDVWSKSEPLLLDSTGPGLSVRKYGRSGCSSFLYWNLLVFWPLNLRVQAYQGGKMLNLFVFIHFTDFVGVQVLLTSHVSQNPPAQDSSLHGPRTYQGGSWSNWSFFYYLLASCTFWFFLHLKEVPGSRTLHSTGLSNFNISVDI